MPIELSKYMNIIVKTVSGKYIVRPDTTWERDSEDFYPPEFINELSWVPVIFARISRPGRSIGERFADRYFDGIGYGLLLYPDDLMDGECGLACASCLDHTSFLPFPVYGKAETGREFLLNITDGNGKRQIFSNADAEESIFRKAIAEATRFIYIRTGDLVAIELQPRQHLCGREDSRVHLEGTFGDTVTMDFNIVF